MCSGVSAQNSYMVPLTCINGIQTFLLDRYLHWIPFIKPWVAIKVAKVSKVLPEVGEHIVETYQMKFSSLMEATKGPLCLEHHANAFD